MYAHDFAVAVAFSAASRTFSAIAHEKSAGRCRRFFVLSD